MQKCRTLVKALEPGLNGGYVWLIKRRHFPAIHRQPKHHVREGKRLARRKGPGALQLVFQNGDAVVPLFDSRRNALRVVKVRFLRPSAGKT